MRKQYHFRQIDGDVYIWDVDNLLKTSETLPVIEIRMSQIADFETNYWYQDPQDVPTCRSIADHARLIQECNLKFPVILADDGSVMDGMHRICRAYIEGAPVIKAKKFKITPPPDFVNIDPNELEY